MKGMEQPKLPEFVHPYSHHILSIFPFEIWKVRKFLLEKREVKRGNLYQLFLSLGLVPFFLESTPRIFVDGGIFIAFRHSLAFHIVASAMDVKNFKRGKFIPIPKGTGGGEESLEIS